MYGCAWEPEHNVIVCSVDHEEICGHLTTEIPASAFIAINLTAEEFCALGFRW